MTLSDLEWPFYASRAISAVAKLRVLTYLLTYLLTYYNNRQRTDRTLEVILCPWPGRSRGRFVELHDPLRWSGAL